MLRILLILNGFFPHYLISQLSNDNCPDAGQLCPNLWQTVDNNSTTVSSCLSCEDDFNLCFVPLNTTWFSFVTYNSGDLTLEIQNLAFNQNIDNANNSLNIAIFQAGVPCFSQSYELIHCVLDVNTNINELVTALEANTEYHVVFSGTQNGPTAIEPSEASCLVRISGPAVERIPASVSIGASPPEICRGAPVSLLADLAVCPDNTDIQWFKNGVFWLSTPSNAITLDDVQNGDTFYAVTSCYEECTTPIQTNTLVITVHDFEVNAGEDLIITQNQGAQLNGLTDASSFYWSPEIGLSDPYILNPIASPDFTTTYFLTASNGICEIADDITVTVISDLIVPNVFSPNGDGINDTWEILGTENYQEVYVVVYDRSGQKVLEAVNYNPLRFWNGTQRGKALPTSTYFYVITLDRNSNKEKFVKGSVTIIQ